MPSPAVLAASTGRACWRNCRLSRNSRSLEQSFRNAVCSTVLRSTRGPSTIPSPSLLPGASVFARSFASSPPAVSSLESSAASGSEPSDQAAIEHFLSSLPTSLVELAPKFTSWPHLIHASSRQLKALGLSVKQRKALLWQAELYKARQRRREMLELLARPATRRQSAAEVQQALYDVAFSHVYGRQWRRAEEGEAQHWWRQATEMNRLRKSFIRNQWNGVAVQTNPESIKPLRNPELMKAKLQAEIDNLKEMEEDGSATLLDRMELLEHEQLMDENERADLKELVEDRLQEMAEDEELREDIKVQLSRARQEQLLDRPKDAAVEAAEAAAEREEQLKEERLLKELKLGSLQQRGEEEQQDDEEQDEADFQAMSQSEQDAVNPYMEAGMSEEQKEDARLELEVDRSIFSPQVREAVMTDMELTLLDYDRDDDYIDETGLGLPEDEQDTLNDDKGDADTDPGSSDTLSITAPVAPAGSATEVDGTVQPSEQSGERPTVARRVQAERQQRTNLSKLFSYNGRKAEQ